MSLDIHSYASPARVRTLVVPIGDLAEEQFNKYAGMVRSSFDVRLVDVTPTKRKLFNPQGFPSGRVIYDVTTTANDPETLFLHDFEPFRKTFVVIGLTDNPNVSKDHIEKLAKLYKSSIVHTAIVFDTEEAPFADNRTIFHHTARNIETIMCDITNILLDSLSDYYTSYQHLTLRSPVTMGQNDRVEVISKQKKRISSGSAISLSLTDPSHSKISLTSANERRQSRIKGRQQKILGNAYLLAGRYTDALREFNEASILLRSSNDYLWLGSTLEGIGVALIMLDFVNVQYQIPSGISHIFTKKQLNPSGHPSSTPVTSPRPSIANSNGLDLNSLTTHELIYHTTLKVIQYYELSKSEPEDFVPNLVYCETILRFLKFMAALNLGGGYNDTTLNAIIKDSVLVQTKSSDLPDVYDRVEILKLSNKILSIQLKKMDILSQARIYSSLSSIYGDLGFQRKRGFILRTLLVSLIPELAASESSYTSHDLTDLLNSLLSIYGIGAAPELKIKVAYSSRWVQLHKSIIQLCIIICEKSKDIKNILLLRSLLLTRYLHTLTENEQVRLLSDIRIHSKKSDHQVNHFDPYLVRGIELIVGNNVPTKDIVNDSSPKTESFIYNPYSKKETSAEANLAVQGEFTEFSLRLQNPFAFELEVNDIQIDNFEIFKSHFILPPKSISTITVLTKPVGLGLINIDKIKIKIFECVPQEFQIIDHPNTEEFKMLKPKCDEGLPVLSAFEENLRMPQVSERAEVKSLALEIIPAQPSLEVLSQLNPIMLLEGGKKIIQLKLKNNSNVPANHIRFSTIDSTTDPLKKALENKDLLASEVYEYEYFLLKEPLKMATEVLEIKPLEEVTVEFEILGKRGLNKINLLVDYGHKLEGGDVFNRRLDIPIPVAVNNSIDLAGCDVVPLSRGLEFKQSLFWKYIEESGCPSSDFVLFLLDLRNVWNKPIFVDIEFQEFRISDTIIPLETKRLIIPVKRFSLKDDGLNPIPNLFSKQYILPKISKAEDVFQREAFWYREEILKNMKGTWKIGSISGEVEFRGIRLSQRMLKILKVSKFDIAVEVKDADFELYGSYRRIKTDEFVTINVTVQNNSESEVKGLLRNIPMSLSYGSVDRRLLYNGTLQQTNTIKLKPGEAFEYNIGITILERGDYEWGVIFDEIDTENQHVCRRPLRIKAV